MAHETSPITARIQQADTLYGDHEASGIHLLAGDVLHHDGKHWIVIREGGIFHLRQASEWETDDGITAYSFVFDVSPYGEIYRPINQAMTYEDVEGATYVEDTGTDFIFAHCSPQQQIDLAADVANYARTELQDAINRAGLALQIATRETQAYTDARDKVDALGQFSRTVAQNAHHQIVSATLGHWHRNPHEDHRRNVTVSAIESVLALWDTLGQEDTQAGRAISATRSKVLADATAVLTTLKQEHSIEWRHVRQKRLNDAEAAKGTDPVAGREYCYAQALFPARITGANNLPDPAWVFDGLRSGRVLRGVYWYSDGEPTPNRFHPWVIRFSRPVPEGTLPGASIGSVAWEQETAYTPPPAE